MYYYDAITPLKSRTPSDRCSEFWNQTSESIGMNDQIEWNTHLRIPDRIAPSAEANCNPKPEFAAGRAVTFADSTISIKSSISNCTVAILIGY